MAHSVSTDNILVFLESRKVQLDESRYYKQACIPIIASAVLDIQPTTGLWLGLTMPGQFFRRSITANAEIGVTCRCDSQLISVAHHDILVVALTRCRTGETLQLPLL
jgi:hypothetical protein